MRGTIPTGGMPFQPTSGLPAGHTDKPITRFSRREDVELTALLSSPPFGGKVELLNIRGALERDNNFAVSIPVRNEECRLPATLDALSTAIRAVPGKGCAIFVLNDSIDRAGEVIERWAQLTDLPTLVVEVAFAPTIRNAPHCRRLALDIGARAAPFGALFTSDADTKVGGRWIESGLQSLSDGYDLVCEDVLLDDEELAALPRQVREVGDTERAYFDICDRLWRYWTYERAGTLALRPSGASIMMKTSAYLAIGGLPTPGVGEDRALCEIMAASKYAIKALENIGTRTSARIKSRASGGCGDALADRANSTDPMCDSRLKPVWLLYDEAARWLKVHKCPAPGAHAIPKTSGPLTFVAVQRELEIARKLASACGLTNA